MSQTVKPWTNWLLWQKALTFGLAYFACALIGQQLLMGDNPFVTFWLPGGLAVATLLLTSHKHWPAYLLALLLANLSFDVLMGRPWYVGLLFAAGNASENTLIAWLVRRFLGPQFSLASVRALAGLLLVSTLAACVNALWGALIVSSVFGDAYWPTWLTWWSGDVLGVLTLAPAVLAWGQAGLQVYLLRWRWLELLLLLASLVLAIWLTFLESYNPLTARTYLVWPLLTWMALRFDVRGIVSTNLALALLLSGVVNQQLGSFGSPSFRTDMDVASIQLYLITMAGMTLTLSVVWQERRQVEERLRRSESSLQKAQNVAQVATWVWYVQQERLEWSDGMYRIFGIDKQHFSGIPTDIINQAIHPDDRAAVYAANQGLLQNKRQAGLEYRVVRPDGTLRTVWVESGELIRDVDGRPEILSGIMQDITERKRAEMELREHQARFASVFRHSPVAIALTRVTDGKLLDVNPAWERMLGYTKAEALAHTSLSLNIMPQPEVRQAVIQMLEMQGEINGFETQLRSKSGELRDVLVAMEVMEIDGQRCLLSLLIDFTERKRSEEMLRLSLHQKEALLREIYHRTKNNMQLIQSMLALQAAEVDSIQVEQVVEAMESKIQAMSLVQQMLYRSQDLSSIDLKDYISELAADLMRVCSSPQQISLRLELMPAGVTFDTATPLGLILNEMLTNACKHAFSDGRSGEIYIRLERVSESRLRLEFADNGVGLPSGFDPRAQTSYGMMSILALSERQLNGQLQIETRQGLHYVLEFPDQVYQPRV